MAAITEDDFNIIWEKLMLILNNYENNFRELSFLKREIESINITQRTRLEYLQKIIAWTYEVASRSYVIPFIHVWPKTSVMPPVASIEVINFRLIGNLVIN